ncbi:acyltransferase family protein [Paenibacillus chitinolyticus]|uniref:acyltransferase family protein n=1 Tax=Paenibacillus chitinolyticus TaxID=79263 RepID=UPI0035DE065D
MKNRDDIADVTKGLLIILVVFGHSAFIQYYSNWHTLIYWFHMPAFIYMSGYFFKPVEKEHLGAWIRKSANRFFIPYFFIISLITIYRYLFTPINQQQFGNEILHILAGGRYIDGYYAPIWFITCLFFCQLIFCLISTFIKTRVLQMIIIMLFFAAAHLESYLFPGLKIPLNIDVAFFALFFYAMGFYTKNLIKKESIQFAAFPLLLLVIYLVRKGYFEYFLDMKQHKYGNILLDILIPLLGTIVIFTVGRMFVNSPFKNLMGYIGRNSQIVMYLHLIAAIELYRLGFYKSVYIFVLIGVCLPLVLQEIFYFIKNRMGNSKKQLLGRGETSL